MHLADKVLDHLFGDLEVGDHAVTQGAYGLDVARRAAQHHLGFVADPEDLLTTLDGRDCDHGGFVEHDATPLT